MYRSLETPTSISHLPPRKHSVANANEIGSDGLERVDGVAVLHRFRVMTYDDGALCFVT